MVKPDEYGAGDLIHMRNEGSFLRGRERERGILAAVRQHLKKATYHNFSNLKSAFSYYDKVKIFIVIIYLGIVEISLHQ